MYYIGIDLGGTKIFAGLVSSEGKLIEKVMVLTRRHRPWEEIGDEIVNCVKDVVKSAGINLSDVKGIGIGCPGAISRDREIIYIAPNLHWKNVPFRKYLYSKTNISFKIIWNLAILALISIISFFSIKYFMLTL